MIGTPRGPSSLRVPRRPRELVRVPAHSPPVDRHRLRVADRLRKGALVRRFGLRRVLPTDRRGRLRGRPRRGHLLPVVRRPRRVRVPPSRARLPLAPVRPDLHRLSQGRVNPMAVDKRAASLRSGSRPPVRHRLAPHHRVPLHPTRPRARRKDRASKLVRHSPNLRRIVLARLRTPRQLRRCPLSRATLHRVIPGLRRGSGVPASDLCRRARTTGSSLRISHRPISPAGAQRSLRTRSSTARRTPRPSRANARHPRTRPSGVKRLDRKLRA